MDEFEKSQKPPSDALDWMETLEGCAQLYMYAALKLTEDPPNYSEALRIIKTAVDAGNEVRTKVGWVYTMSGQASKDLLAHAREGLNKTLYENTPTPDEWYGDVDG